MVSRKHRIEYGDGIKYCELTLGPKYVGGMYTMLVSVATGVPAASVTMNADGDNQGGNC